MRDLDQALVAISDIRSRLAAGTMFRGFGPAVMASTAGLAFATATAQSLWPEILNSDPYIFLTCWIVIAVIAAALIGVEMVARSRRYHGPLSNAMILNAIELFLPAGFAGAIIAYIFVEFAPETLWTLPGLWQMLVALGLFTAMRSLPWSVIFAAAWYFLAGAFVLVVASKDWSLTPWMMGVPFGIGQLLLAGILYYADGDVDAEDEI